MARNVIVNGSGAKEIFVNDGSWQTVKEVWIKNGGSWVQCFPSTGTQLYSTAGTYSFTVPNGIYSLSVPVISGGGGGGGESTWGGDGHGAANGGSGGFYTNQTIVTTPGETLTVVVGAGGLGATTGGNGVQGGRGGTTTISRGSTVLFTATGGYGGNGCSGDNAPNNTNPANGSAGGSPNGVAGSYTATWMVNRNTKGQGLDGKGTNGTGYGTGGLGGNANYTNPNPSYGLAGGDGAVSFSW